MQINYKFITTRALVVGLAVGVLMAGYMVFVVEPVVDEAIALEEQLAAGEATADGHDHGEDELFTRPQQVVGGAVAVVLYSVIAAVIFGTVYAAIRHRIGARSEFGRVTWLAAVGFVAVALLPGIKYPANPPAVGDLDTVGQRTVHYLVLIVVGLVLAWLLARWSNQLRARLSDPARITLMTALSVVAVGIVFVVLPATPDAIDPAVPAELVWDFRIRSLGGLAVLWGGLGLGLGWLLDRAAVPAGTGPGAGVAASAR
jgi:predicted cobalt transporter CbtA